MIKIISFKNNIGTGRWLSWQECLLSNDEELKSILSIHLNNQVGRLAEHKPIIQCCELEAGGFPDFPGQALSKKEQVPGSVSHLPYREQSDRIGYTFFLIWSLCMCKGAPLTHVCWTHTTHTSAFT